MCDFLREFRAGQALVDVQAVLMQAFARLAFVMLTFYSAFDGFDISQIEGVYFIQHYVSKILPEF